MKTTIALLIATAAWGQVAPVQMVRPVTMRWPVGPAAVVAPAVVGTPSCSGGLNSATASAGTTTGAKEIYATVTSLSDAITSWTDTYSNSQPQKLTAPSGSPTVNIYYWENPTVGAAHSFTANYTGGSLTVCVAAFSGPPISGTYESGTNVSHRNGSTSLTVAPGSTSPTLAGYNILITGNVSPAAATGNVLTIDSGYTIAAQLSSDGVTYYGGGLAYLVQAGTAASSPTWTDNHTFNSKAATIAAFKGQ